MWRRPDILDPKVMDHEKWCEIADKPETAEAGGQSQDESELRLRHLRCLHEQLVRLGPTTGVDMTGNRETGSHYADRR